MLLLTPILSVHLPNFILSRLIMFPNGGLNICFLTIIYLDLFLRRGESTTLNDILGYLSRVPEVIL
jgi:hypothetical protein